MNREIKFRCFWKGVKKMKYFEPGNFENVPGRGWAMTFVQPDEKDIYLGAPELMQYTGLTDKNGKEIYEGDIINIYDEDEYSESDPGCGLICTQEVKWDNGGYFCNEAPHGDYYPSLGSDELVFEVIGNIYSNPELLGK